MSSQDKQTFTDSVTTLKSRLAFLTTANAIAINTSINISLRPKEREQLGESIDSFVKSVYTQLDLLLDNSKNIIGKIAEISSLIDTVENKKNETRTFTRDYGIVRKEITVRGYYGEPLVETLHQLCDLYLNLFESEFDNQSKHQKLTTFRRSILEASTGIFGNANNIYNRTEDLISKQIEKSKDEHYKNDLENLLVLIGKAHSVRTATLWSSILAAIGVFIVLSLIWGDLYSKNILVPVGSLILSLVSLFILFNITINIFNNFIFSSIKKDLN